MLIDDVEAAAELFGFCAFSLSCPDFNVRVRSMKHHTLCATSITTTAGIVRICLDIVDASIMKSFLLINWSIEADIG